MRRRARSPTRRGDCQPDCSPGLSTCRMRAWPALITLSGTSCASPRRPIERHRTAAIALPREVAHPLSTTRHQTATQEIIMSTTTAAPTGKVTTSDAAEAGRTTGRPPTDPAGPTGRLATWLAAPTLRDVPSGVQGRAKYLLLG